MFEWLRLVGWLLVDWWLSFSSVLLRAFPLLVFPLSCSTSFLLMKKEIKLIVTYSEGPTTTGKQNSPKKVPNLWTTFNLLRTLMRIYSKHVRCRAIFRSRKINPLKFHWKFSFRRLLWAECFKALRMWLKHTYLIKTRDFFISISCTR